MKGRRWWLIVGWFAVLFVWNMVFGEHPHPELGFGYRCLESLGQMTSIAKLLLLLVGVVVIWKEPWKRKPLAER